MADRRELDAAWEWLEQQPDDRIVSIYRWLNKPTGHHTIPGQGELPGMDERSLSDPPGTTIRRAHDHVPGVRRG